MADYFDSPVRGFRQSLADQDRTVKAVADGVLDEVVEHTWVNAYGFTVTTRHATLASLVYARRENPHG